MIPATLFRWSALLWCAAGYALLAVEPRIAWEGFGNPHTPVLVHAFTLGLFVNGYYALQAQVWPRLYGGVPWPRVSLAVWAIHQVGVALMAVGFLGARLPIALLGAHYLVPTAIAIHAAQGVAATRRRAPGTPRHLGAHAPTFGLLIVMALGAMIILDESTGRYGMFNPPTLLIHGLAGAFLFLFPVLRLAEALDAHPAGDSSEDARISAASLVRWAPLATGLLICVSGLLYLGGVATATGLAVLGATVLWIALPGVSEIRTRPAVLLRAAWLVPSALLIAAAARGAFGLPPGDAVALANAGTVSVLLLTGAPEMLLRLWTASMPGSGRWSAPAIALAVGALALVGQAIRSGEVVHGAAVLGMTVCLWIGWQALHRLA